MKPTDLQQQRKSGFTLIATLLVCGLLTILIVFALVVSQIEESAGYNASQEEIARENALFGLNQAINQLQTSVGPDCRTTARADIINSTSTPSPSLCGYSGNAPSADSGQSYWTGAWKTTANDYAGCAGNGLVAAPDPAPNATGTGPGGIKYLGNKTGPGPGGSFLYYDYLPNGNPNPNVSSNAALTPANFCPSRLQINSAKNVTWLISWPYSSSFTKQPDPTNALANQLPNPAAIVVLANNINANTSANANLSGIPITSITVPKVPIMANKPRTNTLAQTGSFAYWVSDEGIKAKVNVPDPYLAQTKPSLSQGHFQIAQSPNVASVLNTSSGLGSSSLFNSPAASEIRSNTILSPSLASLSYADFVNNTWSDFQTNSGAKYSADFTVESRGVLADNFNGGLRKDLTAALENQQIWFYNFSDLAAGVGVGNTPTAAGEQTRKLYSLNAITGQGTNLIPTFLGGAGAGSIILDGLRWDSLYYYYNLYKANMPSPIYNGVNVVAYNSTGSAGVVANNPGPTGVGSQTNITIPERIYSEPNPNSLYPYLYSLYMDPIIPVPMETAYSTYVALNELTPPNPVNRPTSGGTPGTYDLLFYCQPHLVFYNPYNVLLAQPTNGSVGFSFNAPYKNGGGWCDIGTFQIAPSIGTPATTSQASTVWGTAQFAISTNDTALNPGELRVYGPSKTTVGSKQNINPYPGICFNFTPGYANVNIPGGGGVLGQPMVSSLTPFANYAGEEVVLFNQAQLAALNATLPTNPVPHIFYNIPAGQTSFQGYHDDILTMVSASHFIDTALDSNQNAAWFTYPSAANNWSPNILFTSLYNPYAIVQNFPAWPSSSQTSLIPGLSFNGYYIAALSAAPTYFGTCQTPNVQLGLVGNNIQTPTAKPALDTLALISLYRDGVCGYSTVNNVNETSRFALNPAGICTTPYNMSVPLFASSSFFNPLAMGNNNSYRDLYSTSDSYGALASSQDNPNTFQNGSYSDTTWLPDAVGNTAVGNTASSPAPPPFCIKEIPRGPLISLGQFKNMNCQYWSEIEQCESAYSQLIFSIYPVGGSYQENMPCNFTYFVYPTGSNAGPLKIDSYTGNEYNTHYLDDNFLGNETLFDGYFLSTVPPGSFVNPTDLNNWPMTASFNQSYIDKNMALANSRLTYYVRNSTNTSARTLPTSGSIAPSLGDLQLPNSATSNIRKPAANLLINGAFNINSTSVPAWEAILSSTNSIASSNTLTTYKINNYSSLPVNATFSKSSLSFTLTDVPFLNFSTLASPLTAPNQPWYGLVNCKTSDVSLLARQIVNQILLRGPFLSLGDFLNRRLAASGTNSTISNSGAIQAAIDSTTINNAVMQAAGGVPPYTNYPLSIATSSLTQRITAYPYPSTTNPPPAPTGPYASATGIPGTLMQQDIVQAIAPVIADRSDTFTIRAYGESLNPGDSNKIEGKAWCEAVVQRVPEYIYATENSIQNGNCAYDDPSPSTVNSVSGTTGLAPINSALGRRFKIISFRWLNANEL